MIQLCPYYLTLALLALTLTSCDPFVSGNTSSGNWEYEELAEELIPPCLNMPPDFRIVLENDEDYEEARRRHTYQGDYVTFYGDGVRKSFKLPYESVDDDDDGMFGPLDFIIYVENGPVLSADGDTVSSNPIWITEDSISVFLSVPPYTIDKNIYYKEIFDVDPVTGEITFVVAPASGSVLEISGDRLYDQYKGQSCNFDHFDFSKSTIVGLAVTGDLGLVGVDIELNEDPENRRIIVNWNTVDNGSDAEAISGVIKWLALKRLPDGYEVRFVEGAVRNI